MFKLLFDTPIYNKYGFFGVVLILAVYFALGSYPLIQSVYILAFLLMGAAFAYKEIVTRKSKWLIFWAVVTFIGQLMIIVAMIEEIKSLLP